MGVRYLLDTHVFLWALGEPRRIPESALRELEDRRNELLVSTASAMEVATKVRLGRLESARTLVETWEARSREIGAVDLPITATHALHAGGIKWEHRDPYDRLLVSQALIENVVLVTTDRAISAVPGLRVLAW